ncbi:MAG: hypothetical protein ABFQ89_06800, partial [Chloroflexota bacterium]
MTTQTTDTQLNLTGKQQAGVERRRISVSRILLHVILVIGAFVCIFPFAFMIIKSLSSVYEASRWPPVWIPGRFMFLNYSVSWGLVSFGPTIKIVERSIRYAYIEFWAVLFLISNLLVASLIVNGLRRYLRSRVSTPLLIGLFVVLVLPSLYLFGFGV